MKHRETDLKFLAIGILLSLILSIIFITVVIKNTQHTTYGETYKSVKELRNNLDYDIVLPSFVDSEDNLRIGNVSGGVFTIANKNFRLCGCKYTDTFKKDDKYFRLCPLGFYDKVADDRLYDVNTENESFSLLRIRQGKDFTIFNYLYEDVAYGCIIFENITDEKVLALVNLTKEDISEIKLISKEDAFKEYGVIDVEEGAVAALLEHNDKLYKANSTADLDYYFIEDKLVLIIVNENYNNYLNEYKDSYKFSMIDNKLWLYSTDLEKEFSGDSINYYRNFLLTIESILEAYD